MLVEIFRKSIVFQQCLCHLHWHKIARFLLSGSPRGASDKIGTIQRSSAWHCITENQLCVIVVQSCLDGGANSAPLVCIEICVWGGGSTCVLWICEHKLYDCDAIKSILEKLCACGQVLKSVFQDF